MMLPWNTSLDVEYVGQHSYQTLQGININAVDFGAAFLPQNQDPTLGTSATPGAVAVATDRMRAYRGYAGIEQQIGRGVRTYHSLQLSFQRRFSNGFSFGFNDTIGLYDRQNTDARIQHNADGTWSLRADQAEADELLGNNNPVAHTMKGNFVWDLPDLKSADGALRVIGLVVNDWQLSGIWTAATGGAYTVGFNYQQRRRVGELDWQPGLRRARSHRWRSRSGLREQRLQSVQPERVPGSALQQRRARIRERLPARLLHEHAGSRHRPEHPPGWQPEPAVARRHVQRAELGRHHRPQHDDESGQPERSRHDHEPAVRRERQSDPGAVAAARGRRWRRDGYQNPRTVQFQVRFSF